MDFDQDGDHDLVVVCPDKPYNGTYFFENVQGDVRFPVFKPAQRISRGLKNVQVSFVAGRSRVLSPAREHSNFLRHGLETSVPVPLPATLGHQGTIRANQWKLVDFDGDDRLDIIVGIGDWSDYGWDDAYDSTGLWTNGPLHGYVYLVRNTGSNDRPQYVTPRKIEADGKPIDVFGWPSPNFADFDDDGDLDLLCGEFLDSFTYFENTGSRTLPEYAIGRRLVHDGKPLLMDLQMIVPVAFDWDKDGDQDLIVGDEDGRVALVEHTGRIQDGMPQFLPPHYFQQQAADVKFGALTTPCGFDWDGDGDEDILSGNTAGHIAVIENLGESPPRFAAPRKLLAAGKVIRIQAGRNGSIQGPCEAKWGYTSLTAGDWNHDGLPDLVVNSIWGRIVWYRNVGSRTDPRLAAALPIEVEWPGKPPKPEWNWWDPLGKELVTQWRTTPVIVDWNHDSLSDLVMLDHEGYLALFERHRRDGRLRLMPGKRIFVDETTMPIRLKARKAGGSGRRKLCVVDWDSDGRLDVLVSSVNANWLRQIGQREGQVVLKDMGLLNDRNVGGHSCTPTVVDWNRDGIPELLIGAEDGRFYYAEKR